MPRLNRVDQPDKPASGSGPPAHLGPSDAETTEPKTEVWVRPPHPPHGAHPQKRKAHFQRRLRRWMWRITAAASLLLGAGFLLFAALLWHYGKDLPETSELKN